jgi:PAS domain S-box-containing protein
MFNEIIQDSSIEKHPVLFEPGQTVFLEGDDSQDLYVLLSGEVDILKGNKKIAKLSGKGSFFGEISFLLGSPRTATVRVCEKTEAFRIPKKEWTRLLQDFPAVAQEIIKILAQRLDERSQVLCGLKAFCDQLPDAVILTDREGKILASNTAAERLYGIQQDGDGAAFVEEIYEDPQVYRDFIREARSNHPLKEKEIRIRHPQNGPRLISTSLTFLRDGHHNFQGVLSLGRDVTAVKRLEIKYRRVRNWLLPCFAILGMLSLTISLGYPHFLKQYEWKDSKRRSLGNLLSKDFDSLQSSLSDHLASNDRSSTRQLMASFFEIHNKDQMPFTGLILLDKDKKVFDAYSIIEDTDIEGTIGGSYAGIDFRGKDGAPYQFLSLYRQEKNSPMGNRGVELAFELKRHGVFQGWLVFQMDMDILKNHYKIGEEGLQDLQLESFESR